MPDLFEVNHLCKFYADQYGMIFDVTYDPCFMVLKGRIIFKNDVRKFTIFCAGVSEKVILNNFHAIIYDVLAHAERGVSND